MLLLLELWVLLVLKLVPLHLLLLLLLLHHVVRRHANRHHARLSGRHGHATAPRLGAVRQHHPTCRLAGLPWMRLATPSLLRRLALR